MLQRLLGFELHITGWPFWEAFEDKKMFALQLAAIQMFKMASYNQSLGLPSITFDDMQIVGPSMTKTFNSFIAFQAATKVDISMQTDPKIQIDASLV